METLIGQGSNGDPGQQADLIKDSNMETFAADVLDASMQQPVLVDFWAPWCGPCKQLGPLLEKVVTAAAGKVKLVKVNIDENQEIAQQLRIQSIPAVYAFQNGRPVDGFVGALPESQIKEFIGRLAGGAIGPSPVEAALEDGKAALDAGDLATASQCFIAVLEQDAQHPTALAGLARCYIAEGELEQAQTYLDGVQDQDRDNQDVAGARAALEMAQEAAEVAADPDGAMELRRRIGANAKDFEARYELAGVLNAAGRREEAVDELLAIIQENRNWNEEAARKRLLTWFEAWGQTDPMTIASRRRLSSALFS